MSQSRPTVSISLRAVYFEISQRRSLNYPCLLTDIGDKSWMKSTPGCVHLLDVLGRESGTVQVRTSNSWMRGEDEKNIKGIRRLNLNSSARPACCLTRAEHTPAPPAPLWRTCNRLEIEFALTAGSVTSGSLSGCFGQILWGFSVLIRGGFTWEGLSEPDPVGATVCVCEKESTHTLLTYTPLFGLWLLRPQNKSVLKAWVFIDITVHQIQSPQAIFEPGPVKNRSGPLSPRRRTNSVRRHDAFLKHNTSAHVLVPKTLPK